MLCAFAWKGDAHILLTRAVKAVWGLEALPQISRLPGGKPWFPDWPERHFNLSHSGELSLCALSDAPVGVDLEVIRPRSPGLPAYVFQGEGYDRFLALGGSWPAFYTLWTELESIVKYTGEGLRGRLRTAAPDGCTLTRFRGPGWAAALCGREAAGLTWVGPDFGQDSVKEPLINLPPPAGRSGPADRR